MFTDGDREFFDRLGWRAQTRLAAADPSADRLHAAIESLRRELRDDDGVDEPERAELEELLDVIWWASTAGDQRLARDRAGSLAHKVQCLSSIGIRSMILVDAAQQIRTLVVLAA